MKLVIQIPCLNEEQTLPQTLADLPRQIEGIDQIEILIIDDGSTDRTAEVAQNLGVDHIVRHYTNRGLAAAFKTGIEACLKSGADIIVNTDGDNQYPGSFIPALIRPILCHEADLVIGDRQIKQNKQFSFTKKILQRIGSAVVRYASGTQVPDAPSGFRAFSREAALRINILTSYSYTLETIIQLGRRRLNITHIPIQTNPHTRKSRLVKSNLNYVLRSGAAILQLFLLYEPFRTFISIGTPFLIVGVGLWVRYMILSLLGEAGRGAHVQSVVVGSALIITSALIYTIGLLGKISSIQRQLQEETLYNLKRIRFDHSPSPKDDNF